MSSQCWEQASSFPPVSVLADVLTEFGLIELFGKSTSLQQSLDENNKDVDIDALFGTIPRSLVTKCINRAC